MRRSRPHLAHPTRLRSILPTKHRSANMVLCKRVSHKFGAAGGAGYWNCDELAVNPSFQRGRVQLLRERSRNVDCRVILCYAIAATQTCGSRRLERKKNARERMKLAPLCTQKMYRRTSGNQFRPYNLMSKQQGTEKINYYLCATRTKR
jgi:hypothetical protein